MTPEIEPQVRASFGTLLDAQAAVQGEVARLVHARSPDRVALGRLCRAAHGYANRADELLLTLATQGAPDALVMAVEEIFDAFRDAEGQIEAVIRQRRR